MDSGADQHLTSTEAARLLGVSAATIKRWSDEGVITTVRTPGGHRRFRRADISLAAQQLFTRTGGTDLAELLLARRSVLEIQAHLLSERARLGSWAKAAEACIPVLTAVAARGRSGGVPYLLIRVARRILERAVLRCADELPVRADAPRALVVAVDEEVPGIDLALTCLCLRASSWTAWSGGGCTGPEVASFVSSGGSDVVVLHATSACTRPSLDAVVASVLPPCRQTGTLLLLTGMGPWPSPLAPGTIARTVAEVQAWADASEHPNLSGSSR